MKEPRVLIIDDDTMVSELLGHQLSAKGCVVFKAETGEAGLEVLRSQPVDLVVTDFMMPILNGMEFTRILRGRPEWADIRVIFISANTDPAHRQRALSLGALDYLSKDLGPEAITAKVSEYLGLANAAAPAAHAPDPRRDPSLRLQRVEILAQHLIEVLELAGLGTPGSAATATNKALVLARSKAEEILTTAKGTADTSTSTPAGRAVA